MNQTGRRLLIRLSTQCNSGCAHCTIADIAHLGEKSAEQAWQEIREARARGCDELVFMRGEATLRKDLVGLVRRAREIGYTHIQVQTNARMLAYGVYAEKLVGAGMNFFEVSFFGHEEALHDLIDGTPGAFKQATSGIRNLLSLGAGVLVTVPVVRRNYLVLSQVVKTLAELGVKRVQFNFSRPVKVGPQWLTKPLVRLSEASEHIRRAMVEASQHGLLCETEAVPLCHLAPDFRQGGDIGEDFSRHEVEDVHRYEPSMAAHRTSSRPKGAVCANCGVAQLCPTTWAAYQSLYGTWEFHPLATLADQAPGEAVMASRSGLR